MRIIEGYGISLNHQPSGGKEWVARILGKDRKYGLAREFLHISGRDWSSSGKTGTSEFAITVDGIYEYNEPWKGRGVLRRENGVIAKIRGIPVEVLA